MGKNKIQWKTAFLPGGCSFKTAGGASAGSTTYNHTKPHQKGTAMTPTRRLCIARDIRVSTTYNARPRGVSTNFPEHRVTSRILAEFLLWFRWFLAHIVREGAQAEGEVVLDEREMRERVCWSTGHCKRFIGSVRSHDCASFPHYTWVPGFESLIPSGPMPVCFQQKVDEPRFLHYPCS